MKLFEEYKLYEDMWDDADPKEVVAESATDASWDNQVAQANIFLDAIIKATGNENYDDGDGYWSGDEEWCNRYMYYANSVANLAQVEELCEKLSTDSCNFYAFEDDEEEDPVSEIGYTLTKAAVIAVAESGCKGADCEEKSKTEAPAARYEILYSDRHTEIVDEKTMSQLVDELESFTRDDVLQIHRIYSNGKLGKTIWTEEEGLF